MTKNPLIIIGTVLWVVVVATFLFLHFNSFKPETGPIAISYHGVDLKIDHSDIDTVTLAGPMPFLVLAPNLGDDRSVQKVPFVIELGRNSTGKELGDGRYYLGFGSYKDGEHKQAQLGDGYVMYCNNPPHQMPAFDCAVLLKTLPLAALEYRKPPIDLAVAKKHVGEAEAFLKRAIVQAHD